MGNLFKMLITFFFRIFAGNRSVIAAGETAIKAAGFIKSLVNNPELEMAIAKSANQIDDKILKVLKSIINKISPETVDLKTVDETFDKFIKEFRELPQEVQNALYAKIASEVLGQIYGRKALTESQRDTIVQLTYGRA
jgi:hypothetical protein